MLSLDRWQELFSTIARNKLRTALTSLSVAWGIFMLVTLLGAGTGLRNAMEHNFRDDAVNSIWMYSGSTTIAHEGHAVGRSIQFTDDDYTYLRDHVSEVDRITGRFYPSGDRVVSYRDKKSSFDVRACHPDHKYLENTTITHGRFINDLDLDQRRKVAVIGALVARFLFGEDSALGKWIQIGGIAYLVVGTFEDTGGDGEMRKIYIPISTAQMAYGGGQRIHQLMFTMDDPSPAASTALEQQVRTTMARRHDFSPEDKRALRIRNNVERYTQFTAIFTGIQMFVWLVGFGTVLAGMVGVSNIMLISVKERTKEIGIRKALGAAPASIVGHIVQEAVFLTAVSGYLGLVAGLGVLALVRGYVPENEYVRDPQVEFGVAIAATVMLIVAGALAGFFPARRAAKVDPVVALRDE